MRRDRTGELVEDDPHERLTHSCDRGWLEADDGRVRPCPTCRRTAAPKMTEAHWQQRVIDLARLRGWLWFHPYNSRRSTPGWPDLVLLRDARLIFAELKTETGRVTREQQRWLDALGHVPFVEVELWRPRDWDRVMESLR